MIPKKIHYCWFGGGEMSEKELRCIESWKKLCPDYEIIRWDESNYDVTKCDYTKEAYEAKKWAFVSDYARLDIIYNNGGIYLDTDVEIIKSFDSLLDEKCFLGTEPSSYLIATGLGFGAEKGNENIKAMLDDYNGAHYRLGKDIYDPINCPTRNSRPFYKYGFSTQMREVSSFNGATVYTTEYFAPYDPETATLNITDNTYSIHNYNASWIEQEKKDIEYKINDYSKSHSRLITKIYKNKLECEYKYSSANAFNMLRLILFKLRKKLVIYIHNIRENNN